MTSLASSETYEVPIYTSQQRNDYIIRARRWIMDNTLHPTNVTMFLTFLMLEAAKLNDPKYTGLEKKDLVLETFYQTICKPDQQLKYIRDREMMLESFGMMESLIDFGIAAPKSDFKSTPFSPTEPELLEPDTSHSEIEKLAEIAEQWIAGREVNAANIVSGIAALMKAAKTFVKGDGQTKKDMVLQTIREIVNRESTKIAEADRGAVLAAIDTFAPSIIDFGIDLATGKYDFKGLVQEIAAVTKALCWCCAPPTHQDLDTLDVDL